MKADEHFELFIKIFGLRFECNNYEYTIKSVKTPTTFETEDTKEVEDINEKEVQNEAEKRSSPYYKHFSAKKASIEKNTDCSGKKMTSFLRNLLTI